MIKKLHNFYLDENKSRIICIKITFCEENIPLKYSLHSCTVFRIDLVLYSALTKENNNVWSTSPLHCTYCNVGHYAILQNYGEFRQVRILCKENIHLQKIYIVNTEYESAAVLSEIICIPSFC